MFRVIVGLLSPGGSRSRLTILIFHRVLEQRDELFPNAIHATTFRERMQWIGSWFNVRPLDEAVAALRRGAFESAARYDVIHLRWPEERYRAYGSRPVEDRASAFLRRRDAHKRSETKLIWTVQKYRSSRARQLGCQQDGLLEVISQFDLVAHYCPASVELLSGRVLGH